MPVPSNISELSTTPANNSPAGTETPGTADDYLRAHAAFIATLNAADAAHVAAANPHPQYLQSGGLSGYAPLASPALTGTPTAPTATSGTSTTQLATTAYAMTAAANAVAGVATTFASSAENAAGTVENKAVDPLGIREALNATGSAPVYACRAWVNFNGTGTVAIRASGNVSSITDNGTGDYTVNFTTAMPDANYAVSGFANSISDITIDQTGIVTAYATLYPPTASAFRFTVAVSHNADVTDASRISIAVFR